MHYEAADVKCGLGAELADALFFGVKWSEEVAFAYESFDGVSQVGDHVGYVAVEDMFVGNGCEDSLQVFLLGTAGGGQFHLGETPICLPGVGVRTGLSEVCEGVLGGLWEGNREWLPSAMKI